MNTIEALDVPVPPGLSVLIIPRWDEGDTRLEWAPDKPKEIEAARAAFIKLKAEGYQAYRIDPKSGEKGEKIKEFDEKAQKIVMIPPFAGG